MCFCVIWNKLLDYPKLVFPFPWWESRILKGDIAMRATSSSQTSRLASSFPRSFPLLFHSCSLNKSVHLRESVQSAPASLTFLIKLSGRSEHWGTPFKASPQAGNQYSPAAVPQVTRHPRSPLGICVVFWITLPSVSYCRKWYEWMTKRTSGAYLDTQIHYQFLWQGIQIAIPRCVLRIYFLVVKLCKFSWKYFPEKKPWKSWQT